MTKRKKHKMPPVYKAMQSDTFHTPLAQTHEGTQPPSPDEKPKLLQLIKNLESARNGTRIIIYWLTDSARISEAVIVPLYDQLSKIGKQPNIDLYLFTRGGDTVVPLRIVTLIREFCDHFAVLIPYRAHSAGTELAMGADEIVMTPLGALSPIDPSRTHPLLPRREGAEQPEPISVQDMRHAMQFIMQTAKPSATTDYTPEAMAQIVTALFDKIHPLAIGAIEQSYALAKLIGTRCLSTHMKLETDKEKIRSIVDKLCDDYKSHSYEINRHEAREIGLKAVDAPPDVDLAMMDLLKYYLGRNSGVPKSQLTKGHKFKMYIAWLESANLQMRVEADMLMGDQGRATLLGDSWVEY